MSKQGCFSPEEMIKDANELEFVLFCIENIAEKVGVSPQQIYQVLTQESDILHSYIIPEYETLHTQSKDYIVDDILDFMNEKGVEI